MTDGFQRYEKIEYLGEGQYAIVYKAKDLKTDMIVAVKKIKFGNREEAKDGLNRTALREIKLLQELNHRNIIGLLDAFGSRTHFSLVFDFMDTDLENIIKDQSIILTTAHIKSYILMTLQGLEYLHLHWILHRDLKPNNLLVNSHGILKIADFGLAKFYGSPSRIYTHQVVTRWYRCPELLFGARQYSTNIDVWSVGCILGELLLRAPLFPGDSDLDQLTKIFVVLGTPTEENWPGLSSLTSYIKFKSYPSIPFKDIFTAAADDLLDVVSAMLIMNPAARPNCSRLLQMPFFSNKPNPTLGSKLPLPSTLRKQNENSSLKRKILEGAEGGTLSKKLIF